MNNEPNTMIISENCPIEEMTFGAILSPIDVRDYRIVCSASTEDLPEEFELSYLPMVKNQSNVGACVAYAICSAIEYFSYTQGDDDREMSPMFIYGNRRLTTHTGTGLVVRDALQTACEYGTVVRTLFPGNKEVPGIINDFEKVGNQYFSKSYPNRLESFFKCVGEEEIKNAIITKKSPVIFAMEWYKDIKVNKDGEMVTAAEHRSSNGNHCMFIYGWNEKGWKIQNSHGSKWGNEGRAILPYDIPIYESYGLIDTISENIRKQKLAEYESLKIEYDQKMKELNNIILSQYETITNLKESYYNLDTSNEDAWKLAEEQWKAEIKQARDELSNTMAEKEGLEADIELKDKEISQLKKELENIKKPFSSTYGKIIAKILNFVLNIIETFKKK